MIRKALPLDIPKLVTIGMQAAKHHMPQLLPQREKIYHLVTECVSGAQNIALVSVDDGEIHGALLARTADNTFAERKCSHLLYFACSTPGEGIAMLRQYRGWVQQRRIIKFAGIAPAFDLDQRVLTLFERTGFSRHGSNYIFYN